jgi:hypothetical protein
VVRAVEHLVEPESGHVGDGDAAAVLTDHDGVAIGAEDAWRRQGASSVLEHENRLVVCDDLDDRSYVIEESAAPARAGSTSRSTLIVSMLGRSRLSGLAAPSQTPSTACSRPDRIALRNAS